MGARHYSTGHERRSSFSLSASRSVSRPPIDAVNKALMKLLTSQILLSFRMERTGGRGDVPGGGREGPLLKKVEFVRLRSR